ncbi:TPA: EAL domain-containing protein [Escherichia coli]|nr:EAL domain-containing protein [Escherichia coli]
MKHEFISADRLLRALSNGEFEPYLQPIVSASDLKLSGVELLVRWHTPTGEIIPPTYCVFRSIRSRIGIEVRSAIRIHSINRELNFFYRFLTRFFAAFHCRGIFPQGLSLKDHSV